MSLKDKTILITGASRGIGLAIAKKCAKDGANIAILAKTDQPHPKLPGTLFTAAKEIEEAGGKALPIKTDVRSEEQVLDAVKKTVDAFGGIDSCINKWKHHILYKFNVTISCAVFDTYNFLYCITFSSFLLQHPYFLLYVAAL